MDDLSSLSYISSSSDFVNTPEPEAINKNDQNDISTLKRVLSIIEDRKKFYKSTDSLVYGNTLTVENQLIINHQHCILLQELDGLILDAINKVKELENGR